MHRVNFLLDDKAWKALQTIPKGERSKVIGSALEAAARIEACRKMDEIGKIVPPISAAKIVKQIRKDRSRK